MKLRSPIDILLCPTFCGCSYLNPTQLSFIFPNKELNEYESLYKFIRVNLFHKLDPSSCYDNSIVDPLYALLYKGVLPEGYYCLDLYDLGPYVFEDPKTISSRDVLFINLSKHETKA